MSAPDRRCGTCRYYRGNPTSRVPWDCIAPLPASVPDDAALSMRADDGSECPLWKPRVQRVDEE